MGIDTHMYNTLHAVYYYSYSLVLLPNVEHLYLRHIAVDTLDRYQPDPEVSYLRYSTISFSNHFPSHRAPR